MMLDAILKAASAIFQIIPPQNTGRSSLTMEKTCLLSCLIVKRTFLFHRFLLDFPLKLAYMSFYVIITVIEIGNDFTKNQISYLETMVQATLDVGEKFPILSY